MSGTTASLQEPVKDDRTLREYLADVEKTESLGLYPEYSRVRRRILVYWSDAVKQGRVSLDDPMPMAIEKMKQK